MYFWFLFEKCVVFECLCFMSIIFIELTWFFKIKTVKLYVCVHFRPTILRLKLIDIHLSLIILRCEDDTEFLAFREKRS